MSVEDGARTRRLAGIGMCPAPSFERTTADGAGMAALLSHPITRI